MIFKCGRQNWGQMAKKWVFDRINTSKMQKNEAFMIANSHKYLILVVGVRRAQARRNSAQLAI